MRVFDIHRMSTHDGPGMRTTVFLKGCPLACPWCHNPESISPATEPWWFADRCIHCNACVTACPERAISFEDELIRINRDQCTRCGACVAACPTGALEMVGAERGIADLTREVLRDEPFFRNSGGGVTISGGEPLLQASRVVELAARLHEHGIHVALDTSGAVPVDALMTAIPEIDLVLLDIKTADEEQFEAVVGGDLSHVEANLAVLAEHIRQTDAPELWIRTPVIPGFNDSVEPMVAIAQLISRVAHDVITRWELCAFNPLGAEKYQRLGVPWTYASSDVLPAEQMHTLHRAAMKEMAGSSMDVRVTGMLRNG